MLRPNRVLRDDLWRNFPFTAVLKVKQDWARARKGPAHYFIISVSVFLGVNFAWSLPERAKGLHWLSSSMWSMRLGGARRPLRGCWPIELVEVSMVPQVEQLSCLSMESLHSLHAWQHKAQSHTCSVDWVTRHLPWTLRANSGLLGLLASFHGEGLLLWVTLLCLWW